MTGGPQAHRQATLRCARPVAREGAERGLRDAGTPPGRRAARRVKRSGRSVRLSEVIATRLLQPSPSKPQRLGPGGKTMFKGGRAMARAMRGGTARVRGKHGLVQIARASRVSAQGAKVSDFIGPWIWAGRHSCPSVWKYDTRGQKRPGTCDTRALSTGRKMGANLPRSKPRPT